MLLLGLLMACGGSSDEASAPSERQTSQSTGEASDSGSAAAEQEAISAQYKAFYEALSSVGDLSDDAIRTAFAAIAGPEQIDAVVAYVQSLRAKGQTTGGEVVFSDLAITVRGEQATVTECRDTTTELVLDKSTGAVVKDGAIGTLVEATMNRDSAGTWRVVGSSGKTRGC